MKNFIATIWVESKYQILKMTSRLKEGENSNIHRWLSSRLNMEDNHCLISKNYWQWANSLQNTLSVEVHCGCSWVRPSVRVYISTVIGETLVSLTLPNWSLSTCTPFPQRCFWGWFEASSSVLPVSTKNRTLALKTGPTTVLVSGKEPAMSEHDRGHKQP